MVYEAATKLKVTDRKENEQKPHKISMGAFFRSIVQSHLETPEIKHLISHAFSWRAVSNVLLLPKRHKSAKPTKLPKLGAKLQALPYRSRWLMSAHCCSNLVQGQMGLRAHFTQQDGTVYLSADRSTGPPTDRSIDLSLWICNIYNAAIC